MKTLRTPDERFNVLIDFLYEPRYQEVDGIRIHYIDEGINDSEVVLLMHGEPSWSFLYRYMIPLLIDAGFRVVAPDLVGFGRSDKPTEQSDHTYRKHVDWMTKWLLSLDLRNITLFCQDWGSLIGLRVAIENQDRFKRIILSNGGLPTGQQRMSEAFSNWRELSRTMTDFSIPFIIQGGTTTKLSKEILKAYDAPFADDSFKAGARILPSLVPISPDDPESEANMKSIELFKKWEKPFLTAFSDSDPITKGGDKFWQELVPGAQNQNHITIKGAGHFVQEDRGQEAAKTIIDFINGNP
ncbi:MAG: haloalkane dehalogenase [Candidatus Lokiarchaeota archaeon]|nr:haloalkane dehalogenase [Candidatus Lokiarchaeota archaeon]